MTRAEFHAVARAALAGAGGMAVLAVVICAVLGAWLTLAALLIVLAALVAGWALVSRRARLEVPPQDETPPPGAGGDDRGRERVAVRWALVSPAEHHRGREDGGNDQQAVHKHDKTPS